MALTKLTTDVENITPLSDKPNSTDGLTSAELRALFDKAGVDIKTYVNNTLTSEIDTELGKKFDTSKIFATFTDAPGPGDGSDGDYWEQYEA